MRLTKQWLRSCELIEVLSYNPYLIIVKQEKKKYLLKRIGKCEPNKCKAICCKRFSISRSDGPSTYDKCFGKVHMDSTIVSAKCSKLNKQNKCSIWNHKSFPETCKQFPHPSDMIYIYSMHLCGFKFKIKARLYNE